MNKYLVLVRFLLSQLLFTSFFTNSHAQNWIPHTFSEFDNKVGYIDSLTGETKVFWHFDSAKAFKYGLATACYQGKWGCFNTKGEIIIPFAFSSLELISDSSAEVDYHNWDNEVYFYKGKYKAMLLTLDTSIKYNYTYTKLQFIYVSNSAFSSITFINSEAKQKALQILKDEIVLNTLRKKIYPSEMRAYTFWNSFQVSTFSFKSSGNGNGNGIDLKTGVYYRQKFVLSGFNIGYQRSKIINDTFKYITHQIPFLWSNYFFLKKTPLGNALFTKLDLGCILGTFDFKENKKTGNAYKSTSSRNTSAPNIIMNIGFGFKIGTDNSKSGLIFETGYKFAPIVIAYGTYINHAYVSLGVLL
ncbi:MAG: WG repeat-containing protein [bacterium]|nr:WG repeat-containing protein [bacterium]